VGGVVEEGIAEAALVDEDRAEAGALSLNGAGHAGGTGADDEDVEGFCGGLACAHGYRLDDEEMRIRSRKEEAGKDSGKRIVGGAQRAMSLGVRSPMWSMPSVRLRSMTWATVAKSSAGSPSTNRTVSARRA
jgi:hypothetical protein